MIGKMYENSQLAANLPEHPVRAKNTKGFDRHLANEKWDVLEYGDRLHSPDHTKIL